MCGIAGIFSYHPRAPALDRDELRAVRDHMAPRGPDGKGEWFSPDGRLGLGHRRLAVIDLSERGAQPMASGDGKRVVSFNGEIYNYRSLRSELEARGRVFRSNSDTEVLLHLYADFGARMVQRLRDMFAFALWDAEKNRLLLARDPYGIKPLYYADDGRVFRFASQVKALRAGGGVAREPDPAGIVGFYLFGSVPEPFTICRQVRSLPAGAYLWVTRAGAAEPESYFSIAEVWAQAARQAKPLQSDDLREEVRAALTDSVRQHMLADVPVGAFLSAGVDSGSLVGLMSEVAGESPVAPPPALSTITLAFDELRGGASDEAPLAEQVAQRYGTCHLTRTISERELCGDLLRILEAMDQPSIDGVNTWLVSKAAKEQGWKVALSGLGGDELFAGYPSFRDIPRWVKILRIPAEVPGLGEAFRLGYEAFDRLRLWSGAGAAPGRSLRPALSPKAAGLLTLGGTYSGAYLLRRGLFMPWELPQLMSRDLAEEGLQRLRPLAHVQQALRPDPGNPFGRVAALEASLYLRNQLLRDADWAGMAHSLEIRTPLVDSTLLSRLAGPLLSRRRLEGKALIAGSPRRSLPGEVLARRKSGFTVPAAHWIERLQSLDGWKGVPLLQRPGCHWARRLAYVVGGEAA